MCRCLEEGVFRFARVLTGLTALQSWITVTPVRLMFVLDTNVISELMRPAPHSAAAGGPLEIGGCKSDFEQFEREPGHPASGVLY